MGPGHHFAFGLYQLANAVQDLCHDFILGGTAPGVADEPVVHHFVDEHALGQSCPVATERDVEIAQDFDLSFVPQLL